MVCGFHTYLLETSRVMGGAASYWSLRSTIRQRRSRENAQASAPLELLVLLCWMKLQIREPVCNRLKLVAIIVLLGDEGFERTWS